MFRKSLLLATVLALGGAPRLLAAPPAAVDPEVAKGIKQVDDGDYDAAIITLDAAARRLAADPAKARDLSQAYVHLGIAYVGKGHDAAAKAKFREALVQIKDLTLSPDKYPPKVINVFEAAREEAARAPSPLAPRKSGGGGKTALIIGGVVAVGAGVAVAAGGGGGSSSGAVVDTRKTETFGPITLTQEDCCRDFDIFVAGTGTLEATVTWTEPDAFVGMYLVDDAGNTIASGNQAGTTETRLSAPVTGTAQAPKRYDLGVGVDRGPRATFTLRVTHP